jgi:pyroglutamyl-peptidase
MIKTVLLTGFEPFNNAPVNPSWEAVKALKGWRTSEFAVEVRRLPCVFGMANRVMAGAIEELRPDVVIATGQAGGRKELSVERVAINIDDASILDNEGQQPVDSPIFVHGPNAYFSTLPIKAIVRAMRERGLTAGVSQTAGTFVCNHVFYGLLHNTLNTPVRAGFIHVPFLPEQAAQWPGGAPSMSLDEIVEGLRAAVQVSLSTEQDLLEAGGATH